MIQWMGFDVGLGSQGCGSPWKTKAMMHPGEWAQPAPLWGRKVKARREQELSLGWGQGGRLYRWGRDTEGTQPRPGAPGRQQSGITPVPVSRRLDWQGGQLSREPKAEQSEGQAGTKQLPCRGAPSCAHTQPFTAPDPHGFLCPHPGSFPTSSLPGC